MGTPRDKVVQFKGLEDYVYLCAVEKIIKKVKGILRKDITMRMTRYFTVQGMKNGNRPDSFTGTEGECIAYMEMHKRPVTSSLNEDDVETLSGYGITVSYVDTIGTFRINHKYVTDEHVLSKVIDVISETNDIPDDVIEFIPASTRAVVSESMIDQVFYSPIKDKRKIANALSIMSTMMVKPEYNVNMPRAMHVVRNLVKEHISKNR